METRRPRFRRAQLATARGAMHRNAAYSWHPWLVAALALSAACGTAPEDSASDAPGSDATQADADALCEPPCEPGDSGGGGGVDTAAFDVDPCPGAAGCVCAEDTDCDNGRCLETPDGPRCAVPCVDSCDYGHACKLIAAPGGDLTGFCVPRWNRLCNPCLTSADCVALTLDDSACVARGAEGAFCATACVKDADCPSAYACQPATSLEGKGGSYCTRRAEGGAPADATHPPTPCSCSPQASATSAKTLCTAQTTVDGKEVACGGSRTCKATGLSACDAAAPTPEVCDGLDNDCDGATDDGTCDDNNACTSEVCSGAAGCASSKLDGLACEADGDLCTDGDACVNGTCVPGGLKSCDDGNPCTKDSCDAKKGCGHADDDGAPCDDDNPCSLGDSCATGACKAGVAKVCESGQACVGGACNVATGQCVFTNAPTGKACDDADACTQGDACGGGVCVGSKVPCDDDNACTSDTCSADKGCVYKATGGACDDGNGCTVGDVCGAEGCVAGKVKGCDDANPCTVDACAPATGVCGHDGIPLAGKGCDADGSVCTKGDACLGGICKAGAPIGCEDGNACTNDACDAKAGCVHSEVGAKACDDGNPCTLGDLCTSGACAPGKAKGCDDANPCTVDACLVASGTCSYDGVPLAGKVCDADGSVCTKDDACLGGACKAGTPTACDDGNACTNDACDAKTGCAYSDVGAKACDDGSPCTVGDLCTSGACAPGKAKGCDDANPCTVDACLAASGNCSNDGVQLAGKACDADGSVCSKDDVCLGGVCKAGAAIVCEDNNICTNDACEAKAGCVYSEVGAKACDDGNACTVGDVCAAGSCKAGGPKPCDDGNACTAEGCVQATGNCGVIKVPDGTSCGDKGAQCKGGACLGGCTPNAAKICQAGNVFWQDSCGKTGDLVAACGGSTFCSQGGCVDGSFSGTYLVSADPDTQSMGLLGTAKFPPVLYVFTDEGGGAAKTSTQWGGKTYTYAGTLTDKKFDGAGKYTSGDLITMNHSVKVLWNFEAATPATGKVLPDKFTGFIYETIDTGILGTINLIWKVTGIRQ